MNLVTTRASFRSALEKPRASGCTIGLVPTMGALHEGHLSLVKAAREEHDTVAVTIFVNPTQFGDESDLDSYPRDLDADLAACETAGVDVVFAPSTEEMYPGGRPRTTVLPGDISGLHEGATRPGHLAGVATVVTKLLSMAGECSAYFGEKDYQQLLVVRQLVADLDIAADVRACPTVRELDGLALSSRNRRLDPAAREAAATLYRALEAGRDCLAGGEHSEAAEAAMWAVLSEAELVEPEYAVVVEPTTLQPVKDIVADVRLLLAARVGPVRLIDNLAVSAKISS